ncbi:DUF2147 domain-containing protein [Flexithrix dorotheae]|uniref:DUF2147 domain-containing protein n=1 Tax=Flexithrix dorotheae TaxID=70993 RepID=UPI0003751044|nr:DUF2147 domain-containing protein [Flexithrix dorotheae]
MKKLFIVIFLSLGITGFSFAQSPIGKWKTIDDETGKEKSIVEFYMKGDKLHAKINKLIDPSEPDPVCEECDEDDDRYNKKVIGMEIVRDLEKDDDEWNGGTVLDPENGKVYTCKVWLEDEKTLKLRGYVAFFYRTQTWYRVE